MAAKKQNPKKKRPGDHLVKALIELIEDKIDDAIRYEQIHLFDINQIEQVLSHSIDRRLSQTRPLGPDSTGTTRRLRSPFKEKKCRIRNCQKPAKARGLCSTHYQAARRKGKF